MFIIERYHDKFKSKKCIEGLLHDLANYEYDTFNRVHLSDRMALLNNIKDHEEYYKDSSQYRFLEKHFKNVLLFAERVEVPNLKVTSDVEGTSMLLRKNGIIEIAKRYVSKKTNKVSMTTDTPNKCLISNATREKFFKEVKNSGQIIRGKFTDRYFLSEGTDSYEKWSESMDREYFRLSGIDPRKKRTLTKIDVPIGMALMVQETKIDIINKGKDYLNFKSDSILNPWIKRGSENHCIYDIDGIFLQYDSEPVYLLNITQILSKMPLNDLYDLAEKISQKLSLQL